MTLWLVADCIATVPLLTFDWKCECEWEWEWEPDRMKDAIIRWILSHLTFHISQFTYSEVKVFIVIVHNLHNGFKLLHTRYTLHMHGCQSKISKSVSVLQKHHHNYMHQIKIFFILSFLAMAFCSWIYLRCLMLKMSHTQKTILWLDLISITVQLSKSMNINRNMNGSLKPHNLNSQIIIIKKSSYCLLIYS